MMKKTLFLFIAYIAMCLPVMAQNIKNDDIAGEWKISSVNFVGATLDFKTNKMKFEKGALEALGVSSEEDEFISGLREALEIMRDTYFTIKADGNYEALMAEKTKGKYHITYEAKHHYFNFTDESGLTNRMEISLIKDKLQLVVERSDIDGNITMLFDKKKS